MLQDVVLGGHASLVVGKLLEGSSNGPVTSIHSQDEGLVGLHCLKGQTFEKSFFQHYKGCLLCRLELDSGAAPLLSLMLFDLEFVYEGGR